MKPCLVFLTLLCLCLAGPSISHAQPKVVESEPDTRIIEKNPNIWTMGVIEGFKFVKDPEYLLDYVYWKDVFREIKKDKRSDREIYSPSELKQYYKDSYNNPRNEEIERLEADKKQLSSEEGLSIDASILRLIQEGEQEKLRRKAVYSQMTVSLTGAVERFGERAEAKISVSYKNDTKAKPVKLVFRDGTWWFDSLDIFYFLQEFN